MARKADIDVYTPFDVFDYMGIKYGKGINVKVQCPECRSTSFIMNMKTGLGHCMRSSCGFKANHTSFMAKAWGKENEEIREIMYERVGEEYYPPRNRRISNSTNSSPKKKIEVVNSKRVDFEEELEIASPEVRDNANRAILNTHPFIDRHVKDMLKRGLTTDEIMALPYCSFGYSDEEKLGAYLAEKGVVTEGVPGFFENDAGIRQLRDLKKGILIPFMDSEQRIQGFQLRKNNEELKHWIKDGKEVVENKCNWLSSNGLKSGTKIPAYCHYACDFEFYFNWNRVIPVIKDSKIRLTEGGMKADIIHLLSKESVVAVPGVYALAEFEKELPMLKHLGVKTLIDTFDMDYLTNPDVMTQREKLKTITENAGISYVMETWNTEAVNHAPLKGYDDYLMYHLRGV